MGADYGPLAGGPNTVHAWNEELEARASPGGLAGQRCVQGTSTDQGMHQYTYDLAAQTAVERIWACESISGWIAEIWLPMNLKGFPIFCPPYRGARAFLVRSGY